MFGKLSWPFSVSSARVCPFSYDDGDVDDDIGGDVDDVVDDDDDADDNDDPENDT